MAIDVNLTVSKIFKDCIFDNVMKKILITKMALKTCQFYTKVASGKTKAVLSFAFILIFVS